ncbi:hypothetical protein [Streptomyces sp. NPDC101249]|uniref:hypothetical protein n=1 Tax=Streptomyces sp. NPDC101249 TaxID=3366140 RepID=UPI003806B8B7
MSDPSTTHPAPGPEHAAQRRAVSKFLRRMMPLLVLMLLINNLDRTNVGFVQDELQADVGIGATAYGLGAGLFFIGTPSSRCPATCCWNDSAPGSG